MAEFQAQAYICPVCHDDHSADKPHTFWPAELAAHDAGVWDEGWQKGYDFATRGQRTSDEVNPHRPAGGEADYDERIEAELSTPKPDFRYDPTGGGHRPETS